jgi:hypothetical protein
VCWFSALLSVSDKNLGLARKARWAKAFDEAAFKDDEAEELRVNRKATIVIEQ